MASLFSCVTLSWHEAICLGLYEGQEGTSEFACRGLAITTMTKQSAFIHMALLHYCTYDIIAFQIFIIL